MRGSETGQLAFGRLWPLWYGQGSLRNRPEAVQELKALAGDGYAPAAFALGEACFQGEGIRRDYPAAFRYYRDAAEREYPSAEGALGNFYLMATPAKGAGYNSRLNCRGNHLFP